MPHFLRYPIILDMDYLGMNKTIQLSFGKLLDRIIVADQHVRFAVICDMNTNIIDQRKRGDVNDLLTEEQNKEALAHTINSWLFRNSLSEKIGDARYTLAVYGKLKRLVFPLGKDHLMIVTFDNMGAQKGIIKRITDIQDIMQVLEQANHSHWNDLQ